MALLCLDAVVCVHESHTLSLLVLDFEREKSLPHPPAVCAVPSLF